MTLSTQSKRIPPGPDNAWFGLPILDLLKKDMLGTVTSFREQYGDVTILRLANMRICYLFTPELIREALVDHADDLGRHEHSVSIFERMYGKNLLTTDGETWKRQRRILNPGFLPKRIADYMSLVDGARLDLFAFDLPQNKGECKTVDAEDFMTNLALNVILRVLFSYKADKKVMTEMADAVRALEYQALRESFWLKTPPDWLPYPGKKEKLRAMAILNNFIAGQIQQRRDTIAENADKKDYLAMLLSAHDDEAPEHSKAATLSSDEIHANCNVIFAAGHDTTAIAMTWWLGLMTQYPDYANKVREEIAAVLGDRVATPEDLPRLVWLNATLKEALRMYPSVLALFFRKALCDISIGGWHVTKGTYVNMPTWHIHHDARWYTDPEEYRPERFLPNAPELPRGAFMPFGAGSRVCIGQHFAMMEMAMIGIDVLRHYDLKFKDGMSLPAPKFEILLKPSHPIMIDFIKR